MNELFYNKTILKKKIIEFLTIVLLLFLAFTNLNAFQVSGINFSFYIIFGLVFIVFISALEFKAPSIKKSFPILILLYIILSALINYNQFKVTSVIYSLLFILYYVYLIHYSRYLTLNRFVKVLKFIIIAFFIILILSQLIVMLGLQNLKGPKGYFQSSGQLGILYNNRTNVFRYHSLSSEPSYASIIVLVCFFILNELTKIKRSIVLYGILVLYMLISFKSAIGFLILFLWLIGQVKLTNKQFLIIGLLFLIGVFLFFFTNIGGKSIDRIREVVFLFFSFEEDFIQKLNILDSSVYARVGPFLVYLQDMNIFSYHTYFGHGAASSEPYFSKIVYPEAWNTHMVFRPPFLPGFLYDYGIYGVLIVFLFIWRLIKRKHFFFKFIIVIMLINANFNTQLFWFVLTFITLYHNYKKNGIDFENKTNFTPKIIVN